MDDGRDHRSKNITFHRAQTLSDQGNYGSAEEEVEDTILSLPLPFTRRNKHANAALHGRVCSILVFLLLLPSRLVSGSCTCVRKIAFGGSRVHRASSSLSLCFPSCLRHLITRCQLACLYLLQHYYSLKCFVCVTPVVCLLCLFIVLLCLSELTRNGDFQYSRMSCQKDLEPFRKDPFCAHGCGRSATTGAATAPQRTPEEPQTLDPSTFPSLVRAGPSGLPDFLNVSFQCHMSSSLLCAVQLLLVRLVEYISGQPLRRKEALFSFARYSAAYNDFVRIEHQQQQPNNSKVYLLSNPFTNTNKAEQHEEANAHFSCAALRAVAGWQPDNIFPQTQHYLRRHTRFAIITGSRRCRHFSHRVYAPPTREDAVTDHLRVQLMACLWLYALEGDDMVYLLTDDNRSLAVDTGPSSHLYNLHRYTWIEQTDAQVAHYRNNSNIEQHPSPPWRLAQFRFIEAAEVLYASVARQPHVRWGILFDDDTHLQLNRLASLLHRRDVGLLYQSPGIPWRESASAAQQASWRALCASLTAAELAVADAPHMYESCEALPGAMAAVHKALRQHVGPRAPLSDLLEWLTDLSAMQHQQQQPQQQQGKKTDSNIRAQLWEQSLRLLPPWALERLVPHLYLSSQPFGGTGHYFSRGAVLGLRAHKKQCMTGVMKYSLASDHVLWRCLPHLLHNNHIAREKRPRWMNERRLQHQLNKQQQNYKKRKKESRQPIIPVKEMHLFMWDRDVRFVRTLREPLQPMWDGTVVSVHFKNQMEPTDPGLLYTMGIYHRALYSQRLVERRAATLLLEEWVRGARYCLS